MRILVNAVAARVGGGAHHLGPFINSLADAIPNATIDVYITPDAPPPPDHERVAWQLVDIPSGVSLRRLWWDNVIIAHRASAYVAVISPLNFGPLWCRPPHVLFQRNALYLDLSYTKRQPPRERLKLAVYRWWAILGSNAATWVVVPTQAMADLLRPRMIRRSKVIVAPHTIDRVTARRSAEQPVFPAAQRWAEQEIRLLHVGSPSPHKALDVLAETFALVHRARPEADIGLAVTIAADDGSAPVVAFRTFLDRHDLLSRVTWLGTVDHTDVFPLYQKASLLLLPSRVESFGYPVLEAQAVGCPVVASDLPAIREIGGREVLLHEVDDAAAAAAQALVVLSTLNQSSLPQPTAQSVASNPMSQATIIARLIDPDTVATSRLATAATTGADPQ